MTVSSLLRGIFEIAGTASDYQTWLMYFGLAMLAAGAVLFAGALLLSIAAGALSASIAGRKLNRIDAGLVLREGA